MPDTIIESVLKGNLSADIITKWLNNDPKEDIPEECGTFSCNRSEFVAYFLSYLRNQTDKILQTNTNALQILQHQSTPEKVLNSHRKHRRSISEPNASEHDNENQTNSLSVTEKSNKSQEEYSPNKERSSHKKQGRRVKTKLFLEAEPLHKSKSHEHSLNRSSSSTRTDSDDSHLSAGVERLVSSTPMKNGINAAEYPNLPASSPVTPNESSHARISRHSSYGHLPKEHHDRCDTPRLSHRSRTSNQEKSLPSLGDYIVNAQPSKSSKKKKSTNKNHSNDSTADSVQKMDLDLSNSDMFPEIGAKRQSSSLRSEKERRRIKPTNLDHSASKRSLSLNSFNSEPFQQMSPLAMQENSAFQQQSVQPKALANSFEVERSILKHDRHKLMEKFNILNISSSPKVPTTPQINIIRKDSVEQPNCVKADASKVNFKEKLDSLVHLYDFMLGNNFVLSISTELYFLITILLSRQDEDDYLMVEESLTSIDGDNNVLISDYILRSIHNCSYLAVQVLWRQKYVLELMLDKYSLKLFGENKRVRNFCPDLAKFLLNLYGLKCEAETLTREEKFENILANRFSNGIVCFNLETDNVDNFPSMMSFQIFKKQRDLFYEILRWWWKPETQEGGGARAALRSRVRSLVAGGGGGAGAGGGAPANHAHLARLLRDHLVAECAQRCSAQESKISKLQRRLTGPSSSSGTIEQRLPTFTEREQFYKDVIIFADSESFRVHLRDALAAELAAADAAAALPDDRANVSTASDTPKEYLLIIMKLRLLAKFLGFLVSLPYTQLPMEYTIKAGVPCGGSQPFQGHVAPKERVLESELAMRNYSQPPLDLKGILQTAFDTRRLTITLPWLVQYLAMLDYTSLRLKYYTELLKSILDIYRDALKDTEQTGSDDMKRTTVVYLKLCLGWLFDLPHFPQELYFETCLRRGRTSVVVGATGRWGWAGAGAGADRLRLVDDAVAGAVVAPARALGAALLARARPAPPARHVTPLRLRAPARAARDADIQARLEEELIRSQPSSTRRVLELVAERAAAACVRELGATLLPAARARARADLAALVRAWRAAGAHDRAALSAEAARAAAGAARRLAARARALAAGAARARAGGALAALLAGGAPRAVLAAAAERACRARVDRWLDDNWATPAIICKDVESEIKNILVLGDSVLPTAEPRPDVMVPDEELETVHVSPAVTMMQIKEHICQLLEGSACAEPAALLEAAARACAPRNVFARAPTTAALHHLVLDLCLVYVSRQPEQVTPGFLQQLHRVWDASCPERGPAPAQDKGERPEAESKDPLLECFERVLCPRNIVLLSWSRGGQAELWRRLADLLVFLLRNDYLSEDSLTEQCLAVYRQDWPQSILEQLSACMRSVSARWGRSAGGKFTLFLDFLAEYCDDMDYGQDVSITS